MPEGFKESNPPEGVTDATADIASSVGAGQHTAARSGAGQEGSGGGVGGVTEKPTTPEELKAATSTDEATLDAVASTPDVGDVDLYGPFDNGYHFPPKYSAKDSVRHGAVAFWKYFTTPLGFLVVIYSLNVVAWGGMLFLLLCGAAPAMCYPGCEDIESPRRKWIEWDSQILNALFCVTGLGLIPWRFRDLYWLLRFRLLKEHVALRRLAGIHRSWIRLEGSQNLPVDVGPNKIPDDVSRDVIPFPESKIPDAPLTGTRAPATRLWRVDYVIWMNVWNTIFQCCLCGLMWGMNRITRPSWGTGLFVGLALVVATLGGIGMFTEGKKVKSIEGVALTDEDKEKLARDKDQGIYHYNNIKAKRPKQKASDPEAGARRRGR